MRGPTCIYDVQVTDTERANRVQPGIRQQVIIMWEQVMIM